MQLQINKTMPKTKHNRKHKLILKAAKCKGTRKMSGGWKWGKTPVAAAAPIAPAPIAPSNTGNGPIKSSDVIKTSAAVVAITTLGSIATDYLANPAAMTTITGLVTASSFGIGGAVIVTLLVLAAAWRVLKEKQKAYKGLILVMDELYLVVQKLNGIVEISMFIAATYGFPIDVRDVQLALDAILAKFDELLDPTTDYDKITNELKDFKALRSKFNAQEGEVKEELAKATPGVDAADNPNISLWASVKYNVSNSTVGKYVKKNIIFSAPKFVEELNEAVTYLALYVGIFSASFSTTYTTVALQLLVNDKKAELKTLQDIVFANSKFISMIEGAFVYPLLQSKKTYDTCMVKTDSNNTKCDAIFYNTAENVRKYMVNTFTKKDNVVTGELFSKMSKLNSATINMTEIKTVDAAREFSANVKTAFDEDKKSLETPSAPVQSVPVQSAPVQSVTSATSAPSATSATPPSTTSAANDEVTSEPSAPSAPSVPVQSVPVAAAQVPVPSATPSNVVSSATPLSATPSNVVSNIVPSATPLSEQKKIMDATRMPVMPVMPYIQKNGNNDNKVSIAAGAG